MRQILAKVDSKGEFRFAIHYIEVTPLFINYLDISSMTCHVHEDESKGLLVFRVELLGNNFFVILPVFR